MNNLKTKPDSTVNDGPSPVVNAVTQVALGIIVLFSVISYAFEIDKPYASENLRQSGTLIAIRK
ncbi:MAG: hypothetical protein AB7O26_15510 [Planctomycetaceae bacterium]